jgi:hypothetical protein
MLHLHALNVELATTEDEFPRQATQVEEVFAPTVEEYVFTSQFVHAEGPPIVLYLPATHCVQEPYSPVLPTGHPGAQAAIDELELGEYESTGHVTQEEDVLAPSAVEYVLTSQPVHVALPGVVLYLPAAHEVHAP